VPDKFLYFQFLNKEQNFRLLKIHFKKQHCFNENNWDGFNYFDYYNYFIFFLNQHFLRFVFLNVNHINRIINFKVVIIIIVIVKVVCLDKSFLDYFLFRRVFCENYLVENSFFSWEFIINFSINFT
jgi:hypothetical protein